MPSFSVFCLEGIPEVKAGDSLAQMLVRAQKSAPLQDGDILVLAHKIVSKAEGAIHALHAVQPGEEALHYASICGKDPRLVQIILDEAKEVLWCDVSGRLICRHKLGFICANAGVDCSNSPVGCAISLPKDPDASARGIRVELETALGIRLGVIICDTHGRPFRMAACGVAIGASGLAMQKPYIGRQDRDGRVMRSSVEAIGDELSGAATLVMGQGDEGHPAAVIRGYAHKPAAGSALELIRPVEEDVFYRALVGCAGPGEDG